MKWWLERDRSLSAWLCVAERPGLWRRLAILATHSGDAMYPLLGWGLMFALGSPEWRYRALALAGVDLVTLLVTQALKLIYRRPRPEGRWGIIYRRLDPHSFPSGHAARGGALGLAALLVGPGWFGLPLLVWGALVALSRVMMGVHYLSDVVAGFAVGALVGGAAAATIWL
jgi:undecaprenyl-diphosphatase